MSKARLNRVVRSPSPGTSFNADEHSGGSRSPSPPPSDYEIFQQSDSAEEDFGDDADQEWPVRGVMNEEILLNHEKRYEIEWEGWQRTDGSSTTWTGALPGVDRLLDTWDASRQKDRKQKSKMDYDIDLAVLDQYMPHNIRTAEDAVAYREKNHRAKGRPKLWNQWLAMDAPDAEGSVKNEPIDSSIPNTPTLSVRTEPLERTNVRPLLKRKRIDSDAASSHASSSRLDEESSTLAGSPALTHKRSSSSVAPPIRSRPRANDQRRWEKLTEGTGAAKVTVVNEVDDEEYPPAFSNLQYLESRCTYAAGVPDRNSVENKMFLLGCECTDGCKDISACDCLAESQCRDEYDKIAPAYDKNGLFLFNQQREVVECNENCSCNRTCSNTVAQRPRKVPIEIFKTRNNGWGARSPVAIRKGTVLGLYTGKIMKREDLANLTKDMREYTFDLDIRDDDPDLEERYSICAYAEGNWTRFVNHSCSPNTQAYSVVFDAPLEANMPYIAFVASKDIPARKEITIDYNPSASWKRTKKSTKMKAGATRCKCGSHDCRGYI
ncbi:SET domain-containing protein [Fomitiporia mediterranea MF3/22]|uniref:SET domain-containing protein n=1 Tax=Fomitiporia mediterranea (strain MF3/22) TaxID=694068 RepID=UPI0004408010|nr:SET domain-containing protein [Fomitiporia mediterranea MF3/22]EJD03144.1 SET domain-containing protein [Fomitiporia mediterranea MF3/22]